MLNCSNYALRTVNKKNTNSSVERLVVNVPIYKPQWIKDTEIEATAESTSSIKISVNLDNIFRANQGNIKFFELTMDDGTDRTVVKEQEVGKETRTFTYNLGRCLNNMLFNFHSFQINWRFFVSLPYTSKCLNRKE